MVNETTGTGYYILCDTTSTAVNDLTAAQKTWTYFKTNKITSAWKRPRAANGITIIFDHKNADDDTATFILYAYKAKDAPAEFVCSGNLTSGAQETDDSTTRYYCDTIASLAQRWIDTVSVADAAAGNGVAKVTFDLFGYEYLLCLFTVISSGDDVRAKVTFI